MDPRERADALLSRARARGAFVVTPDNAVSPMDASSTLQIQRAVVRAVDPDATAVVPAEEIRASDATAHHHLAERAPTSELPGKPAEQPTAAPAEQAPATQAKPTATPEPEPDAGIEVEDVDGLIPTTTQRMKSSLSSRLDPPDERPESEFETEDVGGLIPTTTQRLKTPFTRRLDG